MPNVSGLVAYNAAHLPTPGTNMPGIPVALYNTVTGKGATAITDAAGKYLFTNVPAGDYYIIETWGTPGTLSPVDFTANQAAMTQPPEVEPPISALTFAPPALTDALDAVTPNLIKITVAASDFTNENFIDGPVGIKPLDFSGVILTGSNLITVADNGKMGSFAPGTATMTTNFTEPYPGVTPGFVYTNSTTPSDGKYTVMNTRITDGPWWGVSDHTTGIETGRFMLVNGANPGSVIFTQNVTTVPFADYVLTAWVLNLIYASSGYENPKLALEVLAADGSILLLQNVNSINPTAIPVWYQNGFKFNAQGNNNVTIRILSQGQAAQGNDYLIDDVAMYRVTMQDLVTVKKSASPSVIYNGTDVTITTLITNPTTITADNVFFKDVLDPTLVFVSGSVTIDTIANVTANPNTGFTLGNMAGGTSHTVVFHAISTAGASPVLNTSSATYTAISSGSGDIITNTVNSNIVSLHRPLYNLGQSSTDLVESVALVQTALSHIINAEGEKIQAMLAIPGISQANLLAINNSVQSNLDAITLLEGILQQKLQAVKNQIVGC
ncbi:MAG: SpaA isopeptide-forming pilin-related protein [Clostridia bacterium]